MSQYIVDVVRILIHDKDEIVNFIKKQTEHIRFKRDFYEGAFRQEYLRHLRAIILESLRFKLITKTTLTIEELLGIINEDLFSNYKQLGFYLEEDTYK